MVQVSPVHYVREVSRRLFLLDLFFREESGQGDDVGVD